MKKILLILALFVWAFVALMSVETSVALGDITNTSFTIPVGDITPGSTALIGDKAGETVDNVLLRILEKLILMFGVLAALIMTIGAGYMIIYHGQDEFLSKGKSIFMSGIIALVVALSAGIIVKLFAYILY